MSKKLSENELASMENIYNGVQHIKKKDCIGEDNRKTPTCRVSNKNITQISYFLSHKLPKCKKLNITLDNIRNGKIISRGSFGYSFYVTKSDGKNIVIKIIICNNKNNEYNLIDEINIQSKLSQLDEKYSKNFIKLFGYFKNEPTSAYFGAKSSYKYYDITKMDDTSCIFPTKNLKDNCELYLLLEGGERDLHTHMYHNIENMNDIYKIINSFFELLNFYKVSEHFINTENKFFIHCDIKPPNLVIVKEKEDDITIKFIDFGTAKLTTNFIDPTSYGTFYMYSYFLSYNDKIYYNLLHASPLTDIYIVLHSCFEVITRSYNKTEKFTYEYRHNEIKDKVINILKLIEDVDIKKKLNRMIILADIIYNFYQNELKNYHENNYTFHGEYISNQSSQARIIFYDNINIHNLNVIKPKGFTNSFPTINKSTKNNDYNHLDTLMQYILYDEYNLFESEA